MSSLVPMIGRKHRASFSVEEVQVVPRSLSAVEQLAAQIDKMTFEHGLKQLPSMEIEEHRFSSAIMAKIFSHLEVPDLLSCSRVSASWRKQALSSIYLMKRSLRMDTILFLRSKIAKFEQKYTSVVRGLDMLLELAKLDDQCWTFKEMREFERRFFEGALLFLKKVDKEDLGTLAIEWQYEKKLPSFVRTSQGRGVWFIDLVRAYQDLEEYTNIQRPFLWDFEAREYKARADLTVVAEYDWQEAFRFIQQMPRERLSDDMLQAFIDGQLVSKYVGISSIFWMVEELKKDRHTLHFPQLYTFGFKNWNLPQPTPEILIEGSSPCCSMGDGAQSKDWDVGKGKTNSSIRRCIYSGGATGRESIVKKILQLSYEHLIHGRQREACQVFKNLMQFGKESVIESALPQLSILVQHLVQELCLCGEIAQAMEIISIIDSCDQNLHSRLLARVGYFFADRGWHEKAFDISRRISDEGLRDSVVQHIVTMLILCGELVRAVSYVQKGLVGETRADRLSDLSELYESRNRLDISLHVARLIEEEFAAYRDVRCKALFGAYVAKEDYTKARQAAEGISDVFQRSLALEELSLRLLSNGDTEELDLVESAIPRVEAGISQLLASLRI